MSEVIYSPQNQIPMIEDDLRWIARRCPVSFPPTAMLAAHGLHVTKPNLNQ